MPQILQQAGAGWQEAMDNDLNVPKTLGRLFAFIRRVNRLLSGGEIDADQARQILDFIRQADAVLAVIDFNRQETDQRVAQLTAQRALAREAGDFCKADALRQELLALGVHLADTATGTDRTTTPKV